MMYRHEVAVQDRQTRSASRNRRRQSGLDTMLQLPRSGSRALGGSLHCDGEALMSRSTGSPSRHNHCDGCRDGLGSENRTCREMKSREALSRKGRRVGNSAC
jgi:hypothetical protein